MIIGIATLTQIEIEDEICIVEKEVALPVQRSVAFKYISDLRNFAEVRFGYRYLYDMLIYKLNGLHLIILKKFDSSQKWIQWIVSEQSDFLITKKTVLVVRNISVWRYQNSAFHWYLDSTSTYTFEFTRKSLRLQYFTKLQIKKYS